MMDGLEVLKVIKNSPELYSIFVVILTTSQREEDILAAGWENFFSQPELKKETFLVEEAGSIIEHIFENFEDFWDEKEKEVFIGSEHPYLSDNFSLVLGSTKNKGEDIRLIILGPNRLNYRRCRGLINFFENL